jgi:hypothetical protein
MNKRTRSIHRNILLSVTALTALGVLLTPQIAWGYSGALTSADFSILGSGNWIVNGPTTLEWTVTQNADNSWHYAYSFMHPVGETSHLIIETSPSFTEADLLNPSGHFGAIDLGWHAVASGNPGMPEAIYGLKFDEASGLTTNVAFDSFRMPVWGDFYAKNGRAGGQGQNAAWNAGFTIEDLDPMAPPQDGSLQFHLLVPDSDSDFTPEVPEPSTWLLLGTALAGGFFVRRRLRG